MLFQISSGQGPAECEMAVGLLFEELKREFPDIVLLSAHSSRFADGYTSILCQTESDVSSLEGTIQWICKSPFRKNHKRKNWFVDVSLIQEVEPVAKQGDVKFERFHCGGNGGQNVNKVETGVRLIHIPTGITVTSTAQRSQNQNKANAMKKLNAIFMDMDKKALSRQKNGAWREHYRLERGKPIRVYEGEEFVRRM